MTKTQYSYKRASISFLVNHGPQILTTSVYMTLFQSLDRVCDPRYLKLTILSFWVAPDFPKMVTLGYFAIGAKVGYVRTSYPLLSLRKC